MSSDTVTASHILVKHSGSRRLASWKDPDGDEIKNRSKEEAIATLEGFKAQIDSGEKTFAEIATTESDCSSAKNGGNLGPFGRGQMQKPFEDATYALGVGEISGIVDTDSGVHLIHRTA